MQKQVPAAKQIDPIEYYRNPNELSSVQAVRKREQKTKLIPISLIDVLHCQQKAVLMLKRNRVTVQSKDDDGVPLRVEINIFSKQAFLIDGKQLTLLIQTQPGQVDLDKIKAG